MADREWDRDRDRDRYDQPYGNAEFRDQHWGARRHYGNREWDEDRNRERNRGFLDRAEDWWERNVSERANRHERPGEHRGIVHDDRDRGWDRGRSFPPFDSDRGDERRYDREFENRGAMQRDWSDRRVGSDRGYRNTDYSGSWGQQTTGGMRDNYSGSLMHESGRYAGKGPKNWQRSVERIREDINEALTRHPDVDASEVDVEITGSEVTLKGTVSSRHEKRAAEDCAWNVTGVRDVHNHIKVREGVLDRITSALTGNSDKT